MCKIGIHFEIPMVLDLNPGGICEWMCEDCHERFHYQYGKRIKRAMNV